MKARGRQTRSSKTPFTSDYVRILVAHDDLSPTSHPLGESTPPSPHTTGSGGRTVLFDSHLSLTTPSSTSSTRSTSLLHQPQEYASRLPRRRPGLTSSGDTVPSRSRARDFGRQTSAAELSTGDRPSRLGSTGRSKPATRVTPLDGHSWEAVFGRGSPASDLRDHVRMKVHYRFSKRRVLLSLLFSYQRSPPHADFPPFYPAATAMHGWSTGADSELESGALLSPASGPSGPSGGMAMGGARASRHRSFSTSSTGMHRDVPFLSMSQGGDGEGSSLGAMSPHSPSSFGSGQFLPLAFAKLEDKPQPLRSFRELPSVEDLLPPSSYEEEASTFPSDLEESRSPPAAFSPGNEAFAPLHSLSLSSEQGSDPSTPQLGEDSSDTVFVRARHPGSRGRRRTNAGFSLPVSLHRDPITLNEEDLFGLPSSTLRSSTSSLAGEEDEDLLQQGDSSEDEFYAPSEGESPILSPASSLDMFSPRGLGLTGSHASPSSESTEFVRAESEEGMTVALVVALELLPHQTAVQDLVSSHFPLLQFRMRALLQILYHTFTELPWDGPSPTLFLEEHEEWKAAVEDFQRFFCSLMTFPRLQPPLWQQILLAPQKRKSVLCEFLKELSQGHAMFGSGGFLSTILTTVLAYHTTWTRTVQDPPPAPRAPHVLYHFSELFGKTEQANRSCRVVVVGQNSQMVNSLLFILSFFLRSSCLLRHDPAPPPSASCSSSSSWEDGEESGSVYAYTSLWTPDDALHGVPASTEPWTMTDSSSPSPSPSSGLWDPLDSQEEGEGEGEGEISASCSCDHERPSEAHKLAAVLESVPSPVLRVEEAAPSSNPYKGLGRSMFAAHCKSYASDFVLMGVRSRSLSSTSILAERISRDLWAQCKFWPEGEVHEGAWPSVLLQSPAQVAGEGTYTLESASCIVINMDVQSCEVFTFQPHYQPAPLYEGQLTCSLPRFFIRKLPRASLVTDLLDKLTGMWKVDLAPDICLLYFEEALSRLYQRSLAVRSLLAGPVPPSEDGLFTCTTLAQTLCLPSAADAEMLAVLQDQQCADHPLAPRYRLRPSFSISSPPHVF